MDRENMSHVKTKTKANKSNKNSGLNTANVGIRKELDQLKDQDKRIQEQIDQLKDQDKRIQEQLDQFKTNQEIEIQDLHERIQKLEENFLRDKIDDMKPSGKPFGQKESLIVRIRRILQEYDKTACIFNEFLQNADDAGASEIKYLLDLRELKCENTFGEQFKQLQGPALCIWNNQIFSEADIEGIAKLGQGGKRERVNTTGRFGVGVNSAYHLTDVIQFISNDADYVMFDPLCKYHPDVTASDPGRRFDDIDDFKSSFADVYAGFEIPDVQLESCSLFRLALRVKESELSNKITTPTEARQMLEQFAGISNQVILFLNNVKDISFYVIDEQGNVTNLRRCTKQVDQDHESVKEAFDQDLKREIASLDLETVDYFSIKKCVEYAITVTNGDMKERFYMIQQYGYDKTMLQDTETAQSVMNKVRPKSENNCKYFPIASVAFSLDSFNDSPTAPDYKMFNYLPLDHQSPIGCHLNGYWSLNNEDRTSLFNKERKNTSFNESESAWNVSWNESLINFIACPLYIKLLCYLKGSRGAWNSDQLNNYLRLFSCSNTTDTLVKGYFDPFFRLFCSKTYQAFELIPIIEDMHQRRFSNISISKPVQFDDDVLVRWRKMSDVIFISQLRVHKRTDTDFDKVCRILIQLDQELCEYDNSIYCFFETYRGRSRQVDQELIKQVFTNHKHLFRNKNLQDTLLCDQSCLFFFIGYLLYNSHNLAVVNLANLPLLLRNDGVLVDFCQVHQQNCFLLYLHPAIFVNRQDRFVHTSIYKEWAYLDPFKSIFLEFTIQQLSQLINSVLDSNKYFRARGPSGAHLLAEMEPNKKDQINQIWSIISATINYNTVKDRQALLPHLQPIENWCLIPVRTSSASNTISLAPIFDCENIIINSTTATSFSYFASTIQNLPIYANGVFTSGDTYLELLPVSLERRKDLLRFLEKNRLNKQLFEEPNASNILKYLNDCIIYQYQYQIYSFQTNDPIPMGQDEIRRIIRLLPIFPDYSGRFVSLNKTRIERLCLEFERTFLKASPEARIQSDFMDFWNKSTDYILLKDDPRFQNMYLFLGVAKTETVSHYERFFRWALTLPPRDYKILGDHVHLLIQHNLLNENNNTLVEVVKTLPFIDGRRVNELYSPDDELFQLAFKDLLLPEFYRGLGFYQPLTLLGLRMAPSVQDCLKIVDHLQQNHQNIDKDEYKNYVRLVFERISKLIKDGANYTLLAAIKQKKFIPNQLLQLKSNLVSELYKIHSRESFISLSGSYSHSCLSECWLTKPVLPDYLYGTKEVKEALGILDTPSFEIVSHNLELLVHMLRNQQRNERDLLNELKDTEKQQLDRILDSVYTNLAHHLAQNPNKSSLLVDKEVVLITNKDNKLAFVRANRCVEDLNESWSVNGYLEKLPSKFFKHFEFFRMIGATRHLTFEQANRLIVDYSKLDRPLDSDEHSNLLTVLEILFFENIQKSKSKFELRHLPNQMNEVCSIKNLYYPDKPDLVDLVQSSEALKKITVIDIKQLIERKIMIDKSLTWSALMSNVYKLFDLGDHLKPLSSIIDEKVKVDKDESSKSHLDAEERRDRLIKSIISRYKTDRGDVDDDLLGQIETEITESIGKIGIYSTRSIGVKFVSVKPDQDSLEFDKDNQAVYHHILTEPDGRVNFFYSENKFQFVIKYLSDFLLGEIKRSLSPKRFYSFCLSDEESLERFSDCILFPSIVEYLYLKE